MRATLALVLLLAAGCSSPVTTNPSAPTGTHATNAAATTTGPANAVGAHGALVCLITLEGQVPGAVAALRSQRGASETGLGSRPHGQDSKALNAQVGAGRYALETLFWTLAEPDGTALTVSATAPSFAGENSTLYAELPAAWGADGNRYNLNRFLSNVTGLSEPEVRPWVDAWMAAPVEYTPPRSDEPGAPEPRLMERYRTDRVGVISWAPLYDRADAQGGWQLIQRGAYRTYIHGDYEGRVHVETWSLQKMFPAGNVTAWASVGDDVGLQVALPAHGTAAQAAALAHDFWSAMGITAPAPTTTDTTACPS